jgi:hypothetical protein
VRPASSRFEVLHVRSLEIAAFESDCVVDDESGCIGQVVTHTYIECADTWLADSDHQPSERLRAVSRCASELAHALVPWLFPS